MASLVYFNILLRVPDSKFAIEDMSDLVWSEDTLISVKELIVNSCNSGRGYGDKIDFNSFAMAAPNRMFSLADFRGQGSNVDLNGIFFHVLRQCHQVRKNSNSVVPVCIIDSELEGVLYKRTQKHGSDEVFVLPIAMLGSREVLRSISESMDDIATDPTRRSLFATDFISETGIYQVLKQNRFHEDGHVIDMDVGEDSRIANCIDRLKRVKAATSAPRILSATA